MNLDIAINRKQVTSLISKHKYIFIGEIHGTKNIPVTTINLIKDMDKRNVFCLELPQHIEKELYKFLKKQKNNFLNHPDIKRDALHDKRITSSTLQMYKKLYKLGFKLKCLENYNNKNLKERDKEMAMKFINIVNKVKANRFFIYIGNLHLIEKPINLLIFKINPIKLFLPDYIRNESLTIQFFYGKEEKIKFNPKRNTVNYYLPLQKY